MKLLGSKSVCLSLCVSLLTLVAVTTMQAEEKDTKAERKLRHVVVFKFKDSATTEDIKKVEKEFAALPKQISQIKEFEWGTNNSPEMFDRGFTHCFLVTFASEEDRAAYLPHPAHKKFVSLLMPHLEEAFVIDYWAE